MSANKMNTTLYSDCLFSSSELNRRVGYVLDTALTTPVTITRNNDSFALVRRDIMTNMAKGIEQMNNVTQLVNAAYRLSNGQEIESNHQFKWIEEFDSEDSRQQSNVAAATSILAGLVLEKDVIRSVLREEIMRESVIYQDIKAQGIKEGEAKGRAEGIKEGEVSLVLRLLKKRIGEIKAEDESRITGLSVEQLEALGEALLDFSSSDDLSAWLANIQS